MLRNAPNLHGATEEAFLKVWFVDENRGDTQALVSAVLGNAEVIEFEQSLQDELFAVGHGTEVLELLVEVWDGLLGVCVGEVLRLVGDGILLPSEVGRTQKRFAEDPTDVLLCVVGVDDEGTALPLDEEVEVGRELEFGKIHTKGRSHLTAKTLDGDDVHGGDTKAEDHAILDGFRRDTELRNEGRRTNKEEGNRFCVCGHKVVINE